MINDFKLAGNQWAASGRDPIPLSGAFAVMLSVSSVISVATPTVHKSAQSVKPVDRLVPPVPMSGIRKPRSGLRRRDEDQPADASGKVVQTFHYDSFGNAIGFAPSSAITPYLYTQQYYDQPSSTYYDWARNHNTTTGGFTQADYGNYGTLNDPMSMLPYTFTGGDPINLSDLNGHDFTVADIAVSFAINSAITAGLDVTQNLFGADKSLGQIVVDSTIGGFLGVIGGPLGDQFGELITGKIFDILPSLGKAEELARLAAEAAAKGVFAATYTTFAIYAKYSFEHPNGPRLSAETVLGIFLTSTIVTGGGTAVLEEGVLSPLITNLGKEVSVGPAVTKFIAAISGGDFDTASELLDGFSAQEFWQQAVPKLLTQNITGVSSDIVTAFADRFVDFLTELSLP